MMNWSFDGVWRISLADPSRVVGRRTMLPRTVTSVQVLGRPWIAVLAEWEEDDEGNVDTERGPVALATPLFINPDQVVQMEQVITAFQLDRLLNPPEPEQVPSSDCPICGEPAPHGRLCPACA